MTESLVQADLNTTQRRSERAQKATIGGKKVCFDISNRKTAYYARANQLTISIQPVILWAF